MRALIGPDFRAMLAIVGCAPIAAIAQTEAVALEEIVVTARKQAETTQDVPLSVTAFTAARIEELGLTAFSDVAQRTPGLQFGNFGDAKLSPTSLRGVVGSAGSAGSDPAVGMYVDEVFIGQGAGAALDLYDIERVEVLRGPQGTLFGRNTIGGVVNITTKRPSETPEASAQIDYGNYDYMRAGASLSGPLADLLAGKLSAVYEERDGTSDNLWRNEDANTNKHWTMRGQLQFKPSQGTSLLLSGEYFEIDQSPLAFETLRYNQAATLPQLLGLFGLPLNTDPYDRKVYGDVRNEETLELWGVSSMFSTRAGDIGITAIASYRTHEYFSRADTDRSPIRFVYDGDPEEMDRMSGELRLDWTSGSLSWLAGLYYYAQDSSNQSFVEIGADLADLLGAPEAAGFQAGSDAQLDTRSIAGFGNLIWSISDALDLSLGGRYTHEKKEIDYVQNDPLGILGGDFQMKADDTWSQFTPSASLRYRIKPDVMTYVTVSQGFKSGGFNDALGDANGIAFDPEELWNYEIGFKSEWLNRRLIANAALYYMDWSDIQITVDNPVTPVFDPITGNAGKAHSAGAELEIQALITDRFRIDANLSVQEAEYDEGTLPSGEPRKKIPFAPDYTGALSAEYRMPLYSGELVFLGEIIARGESWLTDDNQADGRVDSHQLYGARVGYVADSNRWSLMLWGQNLTNKDVKQRLFDLAELGLVGQKLIALNDPRTYGLTIRVNY